MIIEKLIIINLKIIENTSIQERAAIAPRVLLLEYMNNIRNRRQIPHHCCMINPTYMAYHITAHLCMHNPIYMII